MCEFESVQPEALELRESPEGAEARELDSATLEPRELVERTERLPRGGADSARLRGGDRRLCGTARARWGLRMHRQPMPGRQTENVGVTKADGQQTLRRQHRRGW